MVRETLAGGVVGLPRVIDVSPVSVDDALGLVCELGEESHREVELAGRAGRALVLDRGLDRVSVVLDPDHLATGSRGVSSSPSGKVGRVEGNGLSNERWGRKGRQEGTSVCVGGGGGRRVIASSGACGEKINGGEARGKKDSPSRHCRARHHRRRVRQRCRRLEGEEEVERRSAMMMRREQEEGRRMDEQVNRAPFPPPRASRATGEGAGAPRASRGRARTEARMEANIVVKEWKVGSGWVGWK